MRTLQTGVGEGDSNQLPLLHDLNLDEQVFYSMKFDMGPSMQCDDCPWGPLSSFLFHDTVHSIHRPIIPQKRLCLFRNQKCEGPTNYGSINYSRGQLFRLWWESSGIFVARDTDKGPSYLFDVGLSFLNLEKSTQKETFFTRQGIFYSVIVAQSDETPHTLYGPLPMASVSSHLALVYLFTTKDEKIMDLRTLSQTFVLVVFLFDKQLEEYLPKRTVLQRVFREVFEPIDTIDLFDTRLLTKLKTKILLCTICANYPFYRLE
ncbi:MAG: hypothetical protein ACFFCQ_12020 [Promethearchaeota archaeon]